MSYALHRDCPCPRFRGNSRSHEARCGGADTRSMVISRAVVDSLNSITCVCPEYVMSLLSEPSTFSHAATFLEKPGAAPRTTRQVSAKLCFTLGVGCPMIVNLAVSSPVCFPNGKVGIIDSNLSHREPVSALNWAGYCGRGRCSDRSENRRRLHVNYSASTPALNPDNGVVPHPRRGCVHLPSSPRL